jgi:hypothetical protein
VIGAIVVDRDVWVSASDLRILKCHFEGQIVNNNSILNTRFSHADNHGRCLVVHLLETTLDSSKSVFIQHLLVGLRQCVPGIHQECIPVSNAKQG